MYCFRIVGELLFLAISLVWDRAVESVFGSILLVFILVNLTIHKLAQSKMSMSNLMNQIPTDIDIPDTATNGLPNVVYIKNVTDDKYYVVMQVISPLEFIDLRPSVLIASFNKNLIMQKAQIEIMNLWEATATNISTVVATFDQPIKQNTNMNWYCGTVLINSQYLEYSIHTTNIAIHKKD